MSNVSGVNAAAGTPRNASGALDEEAFRRSLDFVVARGVRGVAINGATGEYCLTTAEELRRMLAIAREAAGAHVDVICGIGAAGLAGVLERGRIAMETGVKALLLPAPHFFPYGQDDIRSFAARVAAELPAPILLYNLPRFTTGYSRVTVSKLMAACPNILGIKDSSGSLEVLRQMTAAGHTSGRIVGNDAVLAQALRERVCDGVISGVAGVVPELIRLLFDPDNGNFEAGRRALDEFIAQIDPFPTPWGLKWIGEVRGIAPAFFAQPLSESRLKQGSALQAWFRNWWDGLPCLPRC